MKIKKYRDLATVFTYKAYVDYAVMFVLGMAAGGATFYALSA